MTRYDYIIIGAGPAGITAALELKRNKPELQVLILEKNDAIGKKLRATGNGRCNISNTNAAHSKEVLEFIKSLGLAVRIYDNGYVYPYSESAADVVDLLEHRLEEAGVEVKCNQEVQSVEQSENADGFSIKVDKNRYFSTKLILALGGKAGSQYGTVGDGYRFARSLGHRVVSPVPVLTSIECEGQDCESIAGIRARGTVSLFNSDCDRNGQQANALFAEEGEIQFTKYGLSGICIFNMTRYMRFDGTRDSVRNTGVSGNSAAGLDQFTVSIDLFPGQDASEFGLRGILKGKLAKYVESHGGDIHNLKFKPTGLKGWKEAQCTSGGVSLDEIEPDTCESKLVTGLYIAGELADYDGPCGGYNINNAIYTGMKVAQSIESGQ